MPVEGEATSSGMSNPKKAKAVRLIRGDGPALLHDIRYPTRLLLNATMAIDSEETLSEIRIAVARLVLSLIQSWEVPPIADRALSNGVYSAALAELATLSEPVMSDVRPLVHRAVRELGLELPSRADAAWQLARHCMERIVADPSGPRKAIELHKETSYTARDVLPDDKHLGDGLDLGSLCGIYWSYDEPGENFYRAENRLITNEEERKALLDTLAKEEALAWLERHPRV
ncbi:hypothetical protein B7486_12150 [cyanobacterium TDX16]|nr:hypothetical protein B7486_12150 [cyanobacterium TDX16]